MLFLHSFLLDIRNVGDKNEIPKDETKKIKVSSTFCSTEGLILLYIF